MALRVDAAGHGETDQVHGAGGFGAVRLAAEHDGADLAGADAARFIHRAGQGLSGIAQRRNVGQEGARVDEHGMPACGLHHRNTHRVQAFGDVGIAPYTVT